MGYNKLTERTDVVEIAKTQSIHLMKNRIFEKQKQQNHRRPQRNAATNDAVSRNCIPFIGFWGVGCCFYSNFHPLAFHVNVSLKRFLKILNAQYQESLVSFNDDK